MRVGRDARDEEGGRGADSCADGNDFGNEEAQGMDLGFGCLVWLQGFDFGCLVRLQGDLNAVNATSASRAPTPIPRIECQSTPRAIRSGGSKGPLDLKDQKGRHVVLKLGSTWKASPQVPSQSPPPPKRPSVRPKPETQEARKTI